MPKYQLFGFNAEGNQFDGFQVKERYHLEDVEIENSLDDNEILLSIRHYFKPHVTLSLLSIGGNAFGTSLTIDDSNTGEPLYELEMIQ